MPHLFARRMLCLYPPHASAPSSKAAPGSPVRAAPLPLNPPLLTNDVARGTHALAPMCSDMGPPFFACSALKSEPCSHPARQCTALEQKRVLSLLLPPASSTCARCPCFCFLPRIPARALSLLLLPASSTHARAVPAFASCLKYPRARSLLLLPASSTRARAVPAFASCLKYPRARCPCFCFLPQAHARALSLLLPPASNIRTHCPCSCLLPQTRTRCPYFCFLPQAHARALSLLLPPASNVRARLPCPCLLLLPPQGLWLRRALQHSRMLPHARRA